MGSTEVRVSVGDVDIFIDFGDGSCVVPNKAERAAARKALVEALELLDSRAMGEIAQDDGRVGEVFKPAERPRLRIVK